MGEEVEADPLEQPLNSSRDLMNGGEPVIEASLPRNRLERDAEMQPFGDDPANGNFRKTAISKGQAVFIAIIVVLVIIIALAVALGVVISRPSPPYHPAASWCPDGWIRIQGKCYYFSKAEGNWTYSQSVCSSHAASLAGIESPQELGSLLPYEGKLDHWIGLRKDTGQVWKWVNGTEFDGRFEIQGGADCVYLDEELAVTTSSCSRPRKWICSKPDTPGKGEERAVDS